MILPITLTIAAAAALISVWLALRVSRLRRRLGVSVGDGGNMAVTTAMRAHANFSEYTPLFLILLGLVELAIGSQTWLWGAAILFVLGRLAHPFGLARPGANALRLGGMVATWVPLLALAVFALIVSYDTRPAGEELEISPVRSSSSEASGGTKLS
jgi:uncharacterized protein